MYYFKLKKIDNQQTFTTLEPEMFGRDDSTGIISLILNINNNKIQSRKDAKHSLAVPF